VPQEAIMTLSLPIDADANDLLSRSPLALRVLAGHVSNPAPNGNPGTGGSPVPRQRP